MPLLCTSKLALPTRASASKSPELLSKTIHWTVAAVRWVTRWSLSLACFSRSSSSSDHLTSYSSAGMQICLPGNQTSHVRTGCSSVVNCWPPEDTLNVSSTRQTVLPLFITGPWIAKVAARVIVVINRRIQSNDVVAVIGVKTFVVGGILTLKNLLW